MKEPTQRLCNVCKQTKSLTDYFNDKTKAYGKSMTCKVCSKKRATKWRKNNKERTNKSNVKHRWKGQGIELTAEQVEEQFIEQNWCCAICKDEISFRYYHYDHNHSTGELRKILCPPCNKGIGFFDDSSHLLKLAFNYLESYADPKKD